MSIGKAIKKLRAKHGLSQKNLAESVGISQGYLSLVEKDLREPGFDLIKKIARVLEVPQQLILLLACEKDSKVKKFSKPLKDILLLADDIIRSI